MMELMSGWDEKKLDNARHSFEEDNGWEKFKGEFLELFLELHNIWEKCTPKQYFLFSNFVFKNNKNPK